MQDDVDRMRAVGAANAARLSALNALAEHIMVRLGAEGGDLERWRHGWDRGDLRVLQGTLTQILSRAKPPARG